MYWWIAKYNDNTIIKKYNNDGSSISADSIDRDRVRIFILMKDEYCILKMFLDNKRKLVYRKRVEKTLGGIETVCHIIGWRMKVGEEIIQSISYVFENGHIEIAGDFQEDHPWFYPPILREFELP